MIKRLWPGSLAGQLVVLLIIALLVAQLAVLALAASDRLRLVAGVQATQTFAHTRTLVRLLSETRTENWPSIVRAFNDRNLRAEISRLPIVPLREKNRRGHLANWIERRLPQGFGPVLVEIDDTRFFDPEHWRRQGDDGDDDHDEHRRGGHDRLTISLGLPDGSWLNLKQRLRPPPIWAGIAWGYFILAAVSISLVAVFAVRRITAPLRQLASAAETFGAGGEPPKLPVQGPIELRKAASAFNEMAARIGRFVRDRTAMVAAISHDLRTPITSLRLRAEFVDDEENRTKMLATLDEMAAMTEATLDFARNEAHSETSQPTDLASLLESLAEDLAEQGMDVSMPAAERQVVLAKPTALKRAFRNLMENAVRYGKRARIDLASETDSVVATIDDDGPGIPEKEMERVFEPFARLETSRNRDTGGTGLGLAIARTIIHAHGGEITLKNLEAGLRTIVKLPKSSIGQTSHL